MEERMQLLLSFCFAKIFHATTSNRHFRTRSLKIKQIFVRLIGAHRRSGVDLVQTDVW